MPQCFSNFGQQILLILFWGNLINCIGLVTAKIKKNQILKLSVNLFNDSFNTYDFIFHYVFGMSTASGPNTILDVSGTS